MDTPKGTQKVLGACCCGSEETTAFVRRFVTAQEELEKLENYRTELKKELTGVEQRIQELKSK